jgi:hypothetical protein
MRWNTPDLHSEVHHEVACPTAAVVFAVSVVVQPGQAAALEAHVCEEAAVCSPVAPGPAAKDPRMQIPADSQTSQAVALQEVEVEAAGVLVESLARRMTRTCVPTIGGPVRPQQGRASQSLLAAESSCWAAFSSLVLIACACTYINQVCLYKCRMLRHGFLYPPPPPTCGKHPERALTAIVAAPPLPLLQSPPGFQGCAWIRNRVLATHPAIATVRTST